MPITSKLTSTTDILDGTIVNADINASANIAISKISSTDITTAARTVLDDASVSAMVDTLGGASATGTGGLVRATSPTLVTPALGTPSSGTLTSCTGLPVSTGISGLGTGVATFLATPSSANLATAVTDETGSGALVFATSPSLTTPTLGVASATSINFGQDALNYYDEGTYTPTVTTTNGADTPPVYASATGNYLRIGNRCHVRIQLYNDGGAEGSGASQIKISIPFTASSDSSAINARAFGGTYGNNAITGVGCYVNPVAGNTYVNMYKQDVIAGVPQATISALTADDQNNTTRYIVLDFWYII